LELLLVSEVGVAVGFSIWCCRRFLMLVLQLVFDVGVAGGYLTLDF
jgi:hypothetical protein